MGRRGLHTPHTRPHRFTASASRQSRNASEPISNNDADGPQFDTNIPDNSYRQYQKLSSISTAFSALSITNWFSQSRLPHPYAAILPNSPTTSPVRPHSFLLISFFLHFYHHYQEQQQFFSHKFERNRIERVHFSFREFEWELHHDIIPFIH